MRTFTRVRVVAADRKSSRVAMVSGVSGDFDEVDVEFESSEAGGSSEDGVAISRLRQLESWELGGDVGEGTLDTDTL